MLLLLLQVPSARAGEEDDRFQQHYDRAVSLFNDKEYDGAAQEFLVAYHIRQLPRLLLNIGQAYRKAGRARQALAFYEHFLRVEPHPDAKLKDDVDGFISATRAMLDIPMQAPRPATPATKPPSPLPPRTAGTSPPQPSPRPPAPQPPVVRVVVPPPKAPVVQVITPPATLPKVPQPQVVRVPSPLPKAPQDQKRPTPDRTVAVVKPEHPSTGSPLLVHALPPQKPAARKAFYKRWWFISTSAILAGSVAAVAIGLSVTRTSGCPDGHLCTALQY